MNCIDKLKSLFQPNSTSVLSYETKSQNQPFLPKHCHITKVPIDTINYVCLDFLSFSDINSLSRASKYFQSYVITPQHLEIDPRLKGTLNIHDIVFLINHFLKEKNTTLFQAFYKSINQAKGLDFEESNDSSLEKIEAKLFNDENLEAISKCHHLEHLNLNQIYPPKNIRNISEDSLIKILKECPRLNSIHLANIPKLTYKTSEVLWRNHPSLMSLNISRLTLTDISLGMIIHHTTSLESIDLSHISHLSNESICDIIKYFPELKSLNIAGLELLGDQTFNLIANQCPKLTSLDVSGIPKFTYKHYQNIKEAHPNLEIASSLTIDPINRKKRKFKFLQF